VNKRAMTYHVVTRWGDSEDAPNERRMREILSEIEKPDAEHPDAWLTHENGWSLAVYESGLVTWENVESSGEPRHQVGVSKKNALELWLKLSRGEVEAIEQEPWSRGQCPPLKPEERAELVRKAEEATLASFRTFYDRLGPERVEVPCRHPGCKKGAITHGLFCRVHHFEMIYHRPCPFQD